MIFKKILQKIGSDKDDSKLPIRIKEIEDIISEFAFLEVENYGSGWVNFKIQLEKITNIEWINEVWDIYEN